jgi:hypothetical protein
MSQQYKKWDKQKNAFQREKLSETVLNFTNINTDAIFIPGGAKKSIRV